MIKRRFLGDVHGKFTQYKKLIKEVPDSVQVGDFGIGFMKYDFEYNLIPLQNPPYDSIKVGNHRAIRGNHDNPGVISRQSYWIPDGTWEEDTGTFYLGGGWSIDRAWRIEGLSWWSDEEVSAEDLYTMIDKFVECKPRILVSHECPNLIASLFFQGQYKETLGASRTSLALQSMIDAHTPEIVICGHWHERRDEVIEGTRFIVLEELGHIDLDV
jgi:hypothetical protein